MIPPTYQTRSRKPSHQNDKNGILRCQGRMLNSELAMDAKTPIFMAKEATETHLLVDFLHRQAQHSGGTQKTLADLRERFWVPRSKNMIKKVVIRCPQCRRYKCKPFKLPPMAALPSSRTSRSISFQTVGIDNFGFFRIYDGQQELKVWGLLVTCFSTRCVYLESVYDLSAESFVKAFRRFVAKRTRPDDIWSDNGTNFVAGEKAIREIWSKTCQEASENSYFSTNQVQWHFTPQVSPFYGGAYERMKDVESNRLRNVLGRSRSLGKYETTLLYPCDFDSIEIIRPVDFLIPTTVPGMPPTKDDHKDPEYVIHKLDTKSQLIKAWKNSMVCLDKFWNRWHQHYLKALREHHQKSHRQPRSTTNRTPYVGEVVILDELAPRGVWILGRVEELIHSRDGEVRAAKILTANGHTLIRAVSLIVPLEVADPISEPEPPKPPPASKTLSKSIVHPSDPTSAKEKPQRQLRPRTTLMHQKTIPYIYILSLVLLLIPAIKAQAKKSWGEVEVDVYEWKLLKAAKPESCRDCFAECDKVGLKIKVLQFSDRVDIQGHGLNIQITIPEDDQEVTLPPAIISS
uniref:Integrase catalytic domain-containing protein n=1 Tax=Acrobeloides nanus TaxID=290746 RepID=A0A914D749_9BILA